MTWIRIARTDRLQDDEVIPFEHGDKRVALFRSDGQYFVTDNVCTHQFALLSDGFVEDGCIECPLHEARFDIRTGKALCGPATESLNVYPVRVEDSDVLVDLEHASVE